MHDFHDFIFTFNTKNKIYINIPHLPNSNVTTHEFVIKLENNHNSELITSRYLYYKITAQLS